MNLHIALSSDENYTPFMATAIISVIENNIDIPDITFHIISVGISKESQGKMKDMIAANNRKCIIYDFHSSQDIVGEFIFGVSKINKYARLYLPKLLPETVDKVIYMDCDAIVLGSLKKLWEIKIDKYSFAGVEDVVFERHKTSINMPVNCKYINSGMLIFNLKKFREENSLDRVEEFMKSYIKRKVKYSNDQAVINALFYKEFYILPPEYNCITPYYLMNSEQIMTIYRMKSYYNDEALQRAVDNPVFVHFTPSFITRPWVKGSRHPLTKKFLMYLNKTPWKDFELKKDNRTFNVKLVGILFNLLPFSIFLKVLNIKRPKGNIK
ncbi:General stress protein [Flagellimonas maritima]|uniref:General stress protein n=1 Tax=Flagellimonas maritima TaxID=1383885 RepID=A0A2Z4LV79_9FLAO|nr:glycosyltransferase family 8 protein [Allomuricauda aurantiaca]AWX45801.1 General stress protein [Allomuricauda aurantiaca]